MTPETKQIFEFAEFRVDLSEKTLLKNDVPVRLTPKALDTLAILVTNAGRLLGKDELMREIWQDRFVEEGNLAFNIKVLRKALGDDAANPRFIETVPRRGYRFIADVRRAASANGSAFATLDDSHEPTTASNLDPESETVQGEVGDLEPHQHSHSKNAAVVDIHKTPDLPAESRSLRSYPYLVLAALAGVFVVAAIGYSTYRLYSAAATATDERLATVDRLTSNGNVVLAALSPDGKFIAYSAGEAGSQSIWLKNIAAGSEKQITLSTEHNSFNSLAFSPDGNYLFYGSKGMLFRLPVLGDTPTRVLSDFGGEIAFSPDGRQFAYIAYPPENRETAALMIADTDGNDRKTAAVSSRPRLFLRSAAWSPDGKFIACVALSADGHQEIAAISVADGSVTAVPSPRWNTVMRIAWKPDGQSLLAVAEESGDLLNQIWSVPFSRGEARRVTGDGYNYQNVAVAADGRSIAAVRSEQSAHLWLMPAGDRQQIKQITTGFGKYDGVFALHWKPDGKIIFANAPSGRAALWQSNEDGSDPKRLAADVTGAAISPDGRFAIFQDSDESGTGLFKMDLEESTRTRLTSGTDDHPAISPDGRSVVFTRFGQDVALWKVAMEGGEPQKITNFAGYPTASVFSPDGSMIAFYRGVSSSTSAPTIAIIPADGGEIMKEFAVPVQFSRNWFARTTVQWSSDGQAVYFISLRDRTSNIFRQPLDGKEPTQITDFKDGLIFNFAFSPDGSKLLISRGSFSRDVILLASP